MNQPKCMICGSEKIIYVNIRTWQKEMQYKIKNGIMQKKYSINENRISDDFGTPYFKCLVCDWKLRVDEIYENNEEHKAFLKLL